ncbi:transcriptional regulator [Aquimarina brevivitae]|uniref:SatD family protein n=1 Tax=Aquimarina brevivitae TaxID=323412 RepID=A0A4Q7P1K0_9FLAO|nr:transcriptional regulator [Aquimarina brevivitae]RZS93723.1 hypothetical protein EV197_2303 [Aquimarina brevivitae]
MIAVLTGDIINSRSVAANLWMPKLRHILGIYGKEFADWEIYRGDTFQLQLSPVNALEAAIHIKSYIKQFKELDVRIGIGIGEKDFKGKSISESNGSAFVNSGYCFDHLKKRTLAIKTPNTSLNEVMNLCLELATLTMDNWPPVTSEVVAAALENKKLNQTQLSKVLDKPQSNISESLNRAGYDAIRKLINVYTTKIAEL